MADELAQSGEVTNTDEVTETDDVAEAEAEQPTGSTERPARRTRGPLRVALALLVVALAFAGWSGWSWYATASGDSIQYANARDAALRAGKEKLAVLTSMDYRHVDKGIERWKRAATGTLHDQLSDTGTDSKTALREAGAVATGKVLAAGITELDAHSGSATMIASVKINIDKQDAPTTTKRNRFVAELERTDAGWKLSALNTAPLGGA